ncbi:putative F-box domain, FBD domain, leucine-rich repeat domain superfamily [Helianthus annuus]|nr:putative F-box domain, FBD domain, leucine-rich repeat domain superfamily [Helianthus annuus]KAJ0621961.1 putative F-box domain, FBD domain, leucine-rich repeat domain superfamily [Helianthus annuus]KAJ0626314.1 putative F-box domain, FBD domain, leucine-rich repeat domain superfamily [Helianthus annuus]KAJ0782660.1 putative F-box domain, FBD domain, leucine-rich repeat domain superfamily [Helianthus annuus]
MKTTSMYTAEQLPLDRLSTLPQPILETILCHLSTKEAARTSILSRQWRYKWTTIPKLEFTLSNKEEKQSDIASTTKDMDMNDLHQILLLRQGPIHELTLDMEHYWEHYICFEFDQVTLLLSGNHTVKKLTLSGVRSQDICYKLPVSVFSLHHLTDLYLCEFDLLDYPPTFDGFGSLESLYLNDVEIYTKNLLHLLSNCSSLKSLDIGGLDEECSINELFKCLPLIEHLTISIRGFQWLVPDSDPQELPTSPIHLKDLCLKGLCLDEDYRILHVLIKCSPNLERFELEVYDMHQILLLRQGPIYELSLQLPEYEEAYPELDQIVYHLSTKYTVKKLTLYGWDNDREVPISIFSFHHLRDLDISNANLYHPPIFNGFGSLESLCLRNVAAPTKTLLHLLLNCPSLKNLILLVSESDDTCTINELLECLPVIEHLTTSPHISKWVVLDSIPQELPTSLIHLRYLCFDDMTLVEHCGLAFLLVFIKCSPNLEKIKLKIHWGIICHEIYSFVWEEYSDVWLEHLNELEIERFNNSKPEMDFVKFILARSPKLKKVTISCIRPEGHRTESEMEMLKTLLQAPHVSPEVIIASKAF